MDIVPIPSNILEVTVPQEWMETAPRVNISNLVTKFNLRNTRISPDVLLRIFPGIAVTPAKFVSVKAWVGNSSMTIFAEGKVVCAGSKSVEDARNSALRLCLTLLSMGENVQYTDFEVCNFVMYAYCPFEIDLARLSKAYAINKTYDDDFPGCTFRFAGIATKITLHVTGAVIIAGAPSVPVGERLWVWFYHAIVSKFRLTTAPGTTNSAAYRKRDYARNLSIDTDVQHVWRSYMKRTTNYSRCSTPSTSLPPTPRTGQTPCWSADSGQSIAVAASSESHLDRMAWFTGHTARCAYIVNVQQSFFERERNALVRVIERRAFGQVIQLHLHTGCLNETHISGMNHEGYVRELCNQVSQYLHRHEIAKKEEPVIVVDEDALLREEVYCSYDPEVIARLEVFRGGVEESDQALIAVFAESCEVENRNASSAI